MQSANMAGRKGVFVLLYVCYVSLTSSGEDNHNKVCHKDEHGVTCDKTDFTLTRLDSGVVGSTKDVELDEGTTLKLKTLCQKPLLFEVPNFLSNEECDHFRSVARDMGLKPSQTASDKTSPDVRVIDLNGDSKLSVSEMRFTIEEAFDFYPHEEDILKMYNDTGLDADNDGFITKEELHKIGSSHIQKYLKSFIKENPEKHARFSSQIWLFLQDSTDDVFIQVQKRVSKLVSLPLELIKLSNFQIVNYGINGHYNAHHDSNIVNTKIPCCLHSSKTKQECRLCRYMTVLFYLNDVLDGGETAFPMANNQTYDQIKVRMERRNLFRKCDDSMLRVLPAKGKAVVWYNHFLDPTTQWLGELDQYSIHGGCPVKKGEKWIANFWINVGDDKNQVTEILEKLSKNNP